MHAAVRAEGLLAPSSARLSASTSAVVCAWNWIVAQLPTASGNTVLQPSWRPSEGRQIGWVPCMAEPELPCTLALDERIHGGPPNVDFTLTLQLVLVWFVCQWWLLSSSFQCGYVAFDLFFLFPQVELYPAVHERWLTAANFDGRSHCSGTMPNFYFREARQLWTLYRHRLQCDFFFWEEKETSTNRQNSKVSWHSIADQSVRIDLPVFGRSAASNVGDLAGGATSLATESTATVLTPGQMSEIAGHGLSSELLIPELQ